jgi:hypothetical protein
MWSRLRYAALCRGFAPLRRRRGLTALRGPEARTIVVASGRSMSRPKGSGSRLPLWLKDRVAPVSIWLPQRQTDCTPIH